MSPVRNLPLPTSKTLKPRIRVPAPFTPRDEILQCRILTEPPADAPPRLLRPVPRARSGSQGVRALLHTASPVPGSCLPRGGTRSIVSCHIR